MKKSEEKILDQHFNVHILENEIELETWTDGGVNMFIIINKNKPVQEQLQNYFANFDVDEEIDLHRQDKRYRDTFKITHSVQDFEDYIEKIEQIIDKLE